MGVKAQVFASNAERRHYYRLDRQWGTMLRIYHNLPFLNVFDGRNLRSESVRPSAPFSLAPIDFSRLKKTSIDFTICDSQDKPIVCIEFDGLSEGRNVGMTYQPRRFSGPWRTEITELKLRVAHGSGFPFFVVGSREFDDLSGSLKLTIVDGIIGEVLSWSAVRKEWSRGFDPTKVGLSRSEFAELDPGAQESLIQDWAVAAEVEADFQHNPIHRLAGRLWARAGMPAVTFYFPSPPLETEVAEGASCTVLGGDFPPIERTVWIPKFGAPGFFGLHLALELAKLLALDHLLRRQRRAS